MRESGPALDQCPSFNTYSSTTMAEVAARVVGEFAHDNINNGYYSQNDDVFYSNDAFSNPEHQRLLDSNGVGVDENNPENLEKQEGDDDDSDFEFAVPGWGEQSSPISADEIFYNGQIRPLFPVFNTDLVFADTDWRDSFQINGDNYSILRETYSPMPDEDGISNSKSQETIPIRQPLKKLMISERETSVTESASCSSSEADELEGVAPETYCMWTPSKQEMRKKSKSTGYSKRWKFRDLLYRSQSDGGNTLVFLTPKQAPAKAKPPKSEAATEQTENYLKNKETRESDRKRSYLPQKQDMMGFFANMNGLSRTVRPF